MADTPNTPAQPNTGTITVQGGAMATANALAESNTNTPAAAPAQPETNAPRQGATEGYLNLGGGKIVNKNSQQYKALVSAGYDDNKIISMYNSKQKLQAPAQQAQTPEVKPQDANKPVTDAKTTPMPVDPNMDDSEARQQEIVNNLNQYKQANPGLFADKALFKKSFSYDNRSELQKQILDNRYGNNIEKANQTSSLLRQPITSIVNQYMEGIISDSDISNMQTLDPARYGEIQAGIEQYRKNEEYKTELYKDDKEEKETPLDMIMAKATSLLETKATSSMYQEYKDQLNSTEMVELKDSLSEKEGEIKAVDNDINATKSELEKKFKGSGISQGQINALIQDQTQLLQNRRNSLAIEYQTLADKYGNKLSTIKDTLEITEKENQLKLQQESADFQKLGFMYNIYSDQQKRDDAFKMADIQYQRDIEKMQKQFDMSKEMTKYSDQIQNGDINSTDPYMFNKAIEKNVDGLMQQFDGLILSSRDQLTERVKEGMKSGKTYSTVLGEIMQDIRNKPEYKAWQNNKLGIKTGVTQITDNLFEVTGPNGETQMMTKDQMNEHYNLPNEKVQAIQKAISDERATNGYSQYDDPATVQKVKDEWLGKDCGVQCAGYTNEVSKKLGMDLQSGSTLQDKITSMSKPSVYSPVPVIGGFVTLDTGATYTDTQGKQVNAGHTGYVTEIDEKNGRVRVLNSNYNGTGDNPDTTVTENRFPMKSVKASTIAAGKGSPSDMTSSTAAPLTDDQRSLYNSEKGRFQSNPVVKEFETAMQQYSDIKSSLDNPSGPGDIAAIFNFMKSLDPSSTVRESEFNSAASSAGVTSKVANLFNKVSKGENLTDQQRKDFTALAKKFVENRASNYNRLYDDMARVLKNNGVSDSYLPTRASDTIVSTMPSMDSDLPEMGQGSMLNSTSLFPTTNQLQGFSRQTPNP